jgi:hypothetical protein
MGLGDAIRRLMKVEHLYAAGVAKVPADLIEERDLIIAALNDQFELNLGFDCNADDVPDTVAIFEQTAQTSCCRILPTEIQKQVQKQRGVGSRRPAQKKRPEEVVDDRARQYSGIKKSSDAVPPRPVARVIEPEPEPLEERVVRVMTGIKKVPDPSPA